MRSLILLAALAFVAATSWADPNPDSPNGLPCTDGENYRGRMKGPWAPDRFDGDPEGIRYSPRWDIFYYAQCLNPGDPGALMEVLRLVIADGKISKPGCNGGRAIRRDAHGALQLCSDEADSYVGIQGEGDDAVWLVGYYGKGQIPGGGSTGGSAPPSSAGSTSGKDYVIGDDPKKCPAPDPTHPYAKVMFGFDMSRLVSAAGTPKYAFAALAQDLPPNDACLRKIAETLGPKMGCLDSLDNYMLDITRDGYVGYRTWNPNYPHWGWFGYNSEHPDPGDDGPAGKSKNCKPYKGPPKHPF